MRYLLLALFGLSSLASAQDFFHGNGQVANAPITITLSKAANGQLSGHYAYQKYQKPIAIEGQLSGDKVKLHTTGQKTEEEFDGLLVTIDGKPVQISGSWSQQQRYNYAYFAVGTMPDPYRDHQISCQEMAQSPALVFKSNVDLGSGSASPNSIDYQCPHSLASLAFIKPLLALAGFIQEPFALPQACTGTIVFAQARYQSFDLARLGYYPQSVKSAANSQLKERYFRQWSYQSLFNRDIYNRFENMKKTVLPQLAAWYQQTAAVNASTAATYASNALAVIADSAYGAFPGSYSGRWQPEPLVAHTEDAINGNSNAFIKALAKSRDQQKRNSLRWLLVSRPQPALIQQLLASIEQVNTKGRGESPLSLAVTKPKLLAMLLAKGFAPNQQNSFGKTPLFYAIEYQNRAAVAQLLAAGADVNHRYQMQDMDDIEYQCDNTITHWYRTPLMHAAQHSDVAMLAELLKAGADINAKDSLGDNAAAYAKKAGKADNLAFLQKQMRAHLH
ncbi:ankyrin repeat domain-containing protein [Gallaecimonas mangrovi]|uniref:ankyrin repeat domain-containing protein n=1 Tax=Gallaecimonas mangrovi TaxID=2291597 RepID=UPI000E202047|nr:ankyrin repeat domain-containing protein [Gallaecimonas mangrovi]